MGHIEDDEVVGMDALAVHAPGESAREAWDRYVQVSPGTHIVGCYTTGEHPVEQASMHAAFANTFNTELVLVLKHGANYSAYTQHSGWTQLPVSLQCSSAERIVLEDAGQRAHYADEAPQDNRRTFKLLQKEYRTVQMHLEKLEVACKYVDGIQNGTQAYDAETLRCLAEAVANRREPREDPASATCSSLLTYLATLTGNLHTLHELSELAAFAATHGSSSGPSVSTSTGRGRFGPCIDTLT